MSKYLVLIVTIFFVFLSYNSAQDTIKNEKLKPANELLIQKLLDKSDLNKYFHANVFPKRSPLIIIINKFINKNITLNKFDKPVVFMNKKNAIKTNASYLEISSLVIKSEKAIIKFMYPPEGIKGTVIFIKLDHDWKLIKQEIIET